MLGPIEVLAVFIERGVCLYFYLYHCDYLCHYPDSDANKLEYYCDFLSALPEPNIPHWECE